MLMTTKTMQYLQGTRESTLTKYQVTTQVGGYTSCKLYIIQTWGAIVAYTWL